MQDETVAADRKPPDIFTEGILMQINHISRMTLVMSTIIFVLPLSAADWPRWLGPTGTGMAAEGCVLRDTIPEDLKPAWVHPLNIKSKTSGGPIVVGGVVYDISVATKARPTERRVLHFDKKFWKVGLKAFSKEHGEALKQLIKNDKNHWPNQAAYESWRDQSRLHGRGTEDPGQEDRDRRKV